MNQPKFKGTGVALVTPFHPGDKSIDFAALERIIEHVIAGGVDYLVCLGTTGEAIGLTAQECRQVLDFTIKINAGRLPIVAGFFGDNNTARLVDHICQFDLTGVAAIMSSSPAYNKPNQEGIFRHYMEVANASPLPVIIYNVPGRTASNVTADTILRLAEASPQFVAVKEASGDLVQAMRIIKNKPEHLMVLSGDDPLTLPLLACGAEGVISVIANAYPAHFSGMVDAALRNDWPMARRLNENLLDVHPHLYAEGNPAGIKGALEILGFCNRETRLPLTALSEKGCNDLRQAMSQIPAFQPSAMGC